jgi:hypothetical protein
MIYICREQEGEEHLLDSQWKYLLHAFEVEEINRGDIGDLPVILVQPPSARYVPGIIPINHYTHPKDLVVYLFGGSHSTMREGDLVDLTITDRIYIPLHNNWELFSSQAAAVVLWDRIVSQWLIR